MRPGERHDPASAYLYGRFYIDAKSSLLSPDGSQSMGFAVRCRDGNTYTIGFSKRTPLQVIKVAPSICQIDEIVYTDAGGGVISRRMAPFRLLQNEILESGGLYYVGDFLAQASESSSSYMVIYRETRFSWTIAAIRDNYDKTTAAMKRAFVAFRAVPTEDRMSR
jgi:hypothetical protein